MRLREVQYIIDKNLEDLSISNYDTSSYSNGGKSYTTLSGFSRLSKAINEIKALGFIDFEITKLKENHISLNNYTEDDSITFDTITYKIFKEEINFIQRESASISILLEKHLREQNEQSVTFGLPPLEKYFEVSNTLSELDLIFDLLEIPKDEVKVQNFDTGSNWIEILFVGTAGLALFGGAIKLVSNAFLKFQECKLAKRKIDEAIALSKTKEDSIKNIYATLDTQLQNDLKPEIHSYLENQTQDTDEERINKTFKGVQKLFNLIDEGASFSQAFNATEKAKEDFPAVEVLDALPTTLKKLDTMKYLENANQNGDS